MITIAVNPERGKAVALARWQPTADYLESRLPAYRFRMKALNYREMQEAIQRREVEFFLTNPAQYVAFETRHRAHPIVTLKNQRLGKPITRFGSVIFRRADRTDLRSLEDLRGKRFMAVDPKGFGGWGISWHHLLQRGIDPARDFQALLFGGDHDQVVWAVREGVADAGNVRTETLETMAAEGKIRLEEFAPVESNAAARAELPFLVTTPLYPEWPLAAAAHTPLELEEQVAVALLSLPPDSPAALQGNYLGWTVPLNYQPVHEVLKLLRAPPYEHYGQVSWGEVVRQHWPPLALGWALLLVLAGATSWLRRLNQRLVRTQGALQERNRELELAQRRMHEELKVAQAMQQAILPDHFPHHDRYQGHALMTAARQVGGDFYDCFPLDVDRLGVVIADVSGKGVPAAFFMAITRTILLATALKGLPPHQCLAEANTLICKENPLELFVTVCYGILDSRTGEFRYANAGHNPFCRLHPDGRVESPPPSGEMAMGVLPHLTYQESSITLGRGELLFLYTDGISEAFNAAGEPFGEERLHATLQGVAGQPAAQVVEGVTGAVAAFAAGAEQSDDITCLALCYTGAHQVALAGNPAPASTFQVRQPADLPRVREALEGLGRAQGLPTPFALQLNLALDQWLTHLLSHGFAPGMEPLITVRVAREGEILWIEVVDNGVPLAPLEPPLPDTTSPAGAQPVRETGIHLFRELMNQVGYQRIDDHNHLRLAKRLPV